MESSPSVSKRISKTQRESHSEIERKRRERMKRDTEFLRKQVSNTQCKDKLSIFQAGAEKLIQYTDKLGKREYIINDEEYSQIIMSNFDGFDIHVRCSDGKVLKVHENVKKILDVAVDEVVGRSLQDLAEPSHVTREIINDAFRGSEFQWDIFKGVIARNFTIALRCGSRVPAKHCIYGCDGGVYRFIEFCGDLVPQTDGIDSKLFTVFRGLCRPLDPVSSTVLETVPNAAETEPQNSVTARHFTLRLSPDTCLITEAVGDFQILIGASHPSNLLNKHLKDLVDQSDRAEVEHRLHEVLTNRSPVTFALRLLHMKHRTPVPFEARLSAICLGAHLHCLICRLTATNCSKDVVPVCAVTPESGHCTVSEIKCAQVTQLGNAHGRYSEQSSSLAVKCTPQLSMSDKTNGGSLDRKPTDIVLLEHNPSGFVAPNNSVEVKSETALLSNNSAEGQQFTTPDQNMMDETWFRDVDTSSFQSLLGNCNPTVESLSPDYLMAMLPDTDPDLGPYQV